MKESQIPIKVNYIFDIYFNFFYFKIIKFILLNFIFVTKDFIIFHQ